LFKSIVIIELLKQKCCIAPPISGYATAWDGSKPKQDRAFFLAKYGCNLGYLANYCHRQEIDIQSCTRALARA